MTDGLSGLGQYEGIFELSTDERGRFVETIVYYDDQSQSYAYPIEYRGVIDGSRLAHGEPVFFDVKNGGEGKYIATRISRRYERYLGRITKAMAGDYAELESAGLPQKNGQMHKSDLASRERIFIDQGEFVEFTIYPDELDRPRHITRVDAGTLLERFAYIKDFEKKLSSLAHVAQPETWKHRHDTSRHEHPILRNFVRFTFAKLFLDEKVAYGRDEDGRQVAAWNTGLVTINQEEIFGFCYEATNRTKYGPAWVFFGFVKGSDKRMGAFSPTPDLANYFESPIELFYDLSLRLELNADHIIDENISRFPKDRQEKATLRILLEQQKNIVVKRIQRNYKTAVPQYARSRIQLLLPLCLHGDGVADLALLLNKLPNMYRAATVLTLPMAYNNARVVTKPDSDWL